MKRVNLTRVVVTTVVVAGTVGFVLYNIFCYKISLQQWDLTYVKRLLLRRHGSKVMKDSDVQRYLVSREDELYITIDQLAQKTQNERDPFYKIPKPKPLPIKLYGISFNEGEKPNALINNEVMVVGDSLLGYEILEIFKEGVIVTDGTKKIELNL